MKQRIRYINRKRERGRRNIQSSELNTRRLFRRNSAAEREKKKKSSSRECDVVYS